MTERQKRVAVVSSWRPKENETTTPVPVSLLALRVPRLHFHAAKRPNQDTRVIAALIYLLHDVER
jgi:hypothetical protein